MSDTPAITTLQPPAHAASRPVWRYTLLNVPDRYGPCLHSLGFRPRGRRGTWHRLYDLRLPGIAQRVLALEEMLCYWPVLMQKRLAHAVAKKKVASQGGRTFGAGEGRSV